MLKHDCNRVAILSCFCLENEVYIYGNVCIIMISAYYSRKFLQKIFIDYGNGNISRFDIKTHSTHIN